MQSIINEKKANKKEKVFKSKWAHLKYLLQNKTSFESSINLHKKQTIEQFSTKCLEIYKDRIVTFLMTQKNKNCFVSFCGKDSNVPQIIVKPNTEDICYDSSIQDFLFYIRENNQVMLKIIKLIKNETRNELIPFLCHFFYENFFGGSEQEEIIYIIYLLLEKEIDNLFVPFPHSFLEESFLTDFLIEFRHKYEIKIYLDLIINSLIRDLEEQFPNNFHMNMVLSSLYDIRNINNNIFFDMTNQKFKVNELFNSSPVNDDFFVVKKDMTMPPLKRSWNLKASLKRKTSENEKEEQIKYEEKKTIDKFINKNFFNVITNNTLKKKFEEEKDEYMRSFYMKQLKMLNLIKKPNAFNCRDYYFNKMVKANNISMKSINNYNEGYNIITKFISNLLNNLENKKIIPYYIKVICKIINILLKKKFRDISKIQINEFIFKFIFNILIIPTIQNPDNSDLETTTMISLDTRKNLLRIEKVLKKLIKGELFYEEDDEHYKIFNQFIIDNYKKLQNIVKLFMDVKIPNKIMLLTEQFYDAKFVSLDKIKRHPSDINYDYFEENPNDFMQHYCICFNTRQLMSIYMLIYSQKDSFLKEDKNFEIIFNNISKIMHRNCMEDINNMDIFYLAIKENFNDNVKNLLYHKEKNIGLAKNENVLHKLKFCLVYLLSKIKDFPYWNCINEDYNTKQTFDYINKYLIYKEMKSKSPLNWYSKFILEYLELIDKKYIENDYNLLYEELEDEVKNVLKRLKKLNEFLTVDIKTKFNLIENKKNSFKHELENMKKIDLNIRTLFFIETQKIEVCLMNGEDYNQFHQKHEFNEKKLSKHTLIIKEKKSCPHHKLEEEKYGKIKKKGGFTKFHCNDIRHFTEKFSEFQNIITSEIMTHSFDKELKIIKTFHSNSYLIIENDERITESPKEIFDFYMNLLSRTIDEKEEIKDKEKKDKLLKNIRNYILKKMCANIYTYEPLNMDKDFNLKCKLYNELFKLKKPTLNIPEIILKDNLLNSVKIHFQNIENKRTPDGMNEEFGLAVRLIESLYKFYFNQNEIDAGESLYIIIYCIILIVPKRFVFNINFTQFFLSQSENTGNIGYNMTQADSAINYIKDVNPKELGFSGEDFNKAALKLKADK
jgi:hypothetical protein